MKHVPRLLRIVGLLLCFLLVGSACRRTPERAVEETAEPTPTESPEPVTFELTGQITAVFERSAFTGSTDELGGAPFDSPTPTPVATGGESQLGGVVVRLQTLSESLTDCGFQQDDRAIVLFGENVRRDVDQAFAAGNLPRNLLGERASAKGDIDEVGGECVLVANELTIGLRPIATATARARTGVRRATPTPTARATPTKTPPRATGPTGVTGATGATGLTGPG